MNSSIVLLSTKEIKINNNACKKVNDIMSNYPSIDYLVTYAINILNKHQTSKIGFISLLNLQLQYQKKIVCFKVQKYQYGRYFYLYCSR